MFFPPFFFSRPQMHGASSLLCVMCLMVGSRGRRPALPLVPEAMPMD